MRPNLAGVTAASALVLALTGGMVGGMMTRGADPEPAPAAPETVAVAPVADEATPSAAPAPPSAAPTKETEPVTEAPEQQPAQGTEEAPVVATPEEPAAPQPKPKPAAPPAEEPAEEPAAQPTTAPLEDSVDFDATTCGGRPRASLKDADRDDPSLACVTERGKQTWTTGNLRAGQECLPGQGKSDGISTWRCENYQWVLVEEAPPQ